MAALVRLSFIALLATACADHGPKLEELRAPAATTASADPVLAIDPGTGDLLLAWVQKDGAGWQVLFARSGDGGGEWSAPVKVTDRADDVHPHGESSPRLVAGPGGMIGIAWTNSVPAPGRRWPGSNIRFSRSIDGGAQWSPAITLNDDTTAGPAGHIFHGAAWQGDSGLVVAWMDERGGAAAENPESSEMTGHHAETVEEPDATIYAVGSNNLGRSWGPNVALWGAACPCCRIALQRGTDGGVVAGWRQHFHDNIRDIVVAPMVHSITLVEPQRVHVDDWVYPGCPHTGPGVAIGADGAVHVAWYTGKPGAAGVLYAKGNGPLGEGFSDPVVLLAAATLPTAHPRVAALPDSGALVVWDVTMGGRNQLAVARVYGTHAASTILANSAGADHPEIMTLRDGTGIAAWTSRQGGGDSTRVRIARIRLR